MFLESAPKILITIDVEDWFQVENLRPWFPPDTWDRQKPRVERNVSRLLDLFDHVGPSVKATFFVLGWIAEKFPGLVRDIRSRGHELASHGNSHLLNDSLSQADLRRDLETSKKLLEEISGEEVIGYRAPSFSVNDRVLNMIQDSGYRYDSSYNSFGRHGRYGHISTAGHSKTGAALEIGRQFAELPISNLVFFGQTLPWGGGGYFRLLPLTFFIQGVGRILKEHGVYVFYMHPWEIDPEQPRIIAAKGKNVWRHYLNLEKTHQRLVKFISRFKHCRFVTCRHYLNSIGLCQPVRQGQVQPVQ